MPTVSVPEGVAKYLLIDGQQRLTTIFLLLALLRDRAREAKRDSLAEEIANTLLINPYKTGADRYKLLPTQIDRQAFRSLIDRTDQPSEGSQLLSAYRFFEREMRKNPNIDIEQLKLVVSKYLSAVSITLDPLDNPHLVFEGLNAKGRPLTQADLIRNYFIMRVHVDAQEAVHAQYWSPMQDRLGSALTEYIRHYLIMQLGDTVNVNDVYFVLKDNVSTDNAVDYLAKLERFSRYYARFLTPEHEANARIRHRLSRIRRLDVGVSYPFLLSCYSAYDEHRISEDELCDVMDVIENFSIRRFVCNVPTYGLNKIFAALYSQIDRLKPASLAQGLKAVLQTKNYPKNYDFSQKLKDAKLYGAGDRIVKTKLILEALESSFAHKEQVSFEDLTIEHVMPQTLTKEWHTELGSDAEMTHELYLHTIGNLTLTGYNPELSNEPFRVKRDLLKGSHLELNGCFDSVSRWSREEIKDRGSSLADRALTIWPYFGDESTQEVSASDVVGKVPAALWILGQKFGVASWRDVMETTIDTLAELEPDRFQQLLKEFPHFVGQDKTRFRATRALKCGAFIEVNLGAESIYRFCNTAMSAIGLTSEDWKVETHAPVPSVAIATASPD
jgi:uncharacterized protein with ParB-like and HNH nuclease domain